MRVELALTSMDGIEPAFGQSTVESELHVPGALELLEDDLVHLGPGLHQGGGENGERPTLFDVPGGAEEPLGRVQRPESTPPDMIRPLAGCARL